MEKAGKLRDGRKRLLLLFVCLGLYGLVIFLVLPIYESLFPKIVKMEGTLYSGEGISAPEYGTIFWGNHFDDVDTIYINGRENKDCRFLDCSDNRIVVDIPREIYYGMDAFDIQVSKKIGGIYPCKTKKYKVRIEENPREAPEITEMTDSGIYPGQGTLNICITMKDMEAETAFYVNGEAIDAIEHIDGDTLEIAVPPRMYKGREYIEIMPIVDLGGGQKLYGSAVEWGTGDLKKVRYEHSYEMAKKNDVIMQSAGEWQGLTGTNSREAFLYYYEKGCRAFEIDLSVTKDGVIAGDYDSREHNLPRTYEEICDLYQEWTPLSWGDMLEYLKTDEELYFVIDTRYDNAEALTYLLGRMVEEAKQQEMESALERAVIQFDSRDMYQRIMEVYPFSSVLFELPQTAADSGEVLEFIGDSDIRMISLTAGSEWDRGAFLQELNSRGCYVYVHTVNSVTRMADYMEKGCRGIYTDSVTEEQVAEMDAEFTREQEENKQFLIDYLQEIRNEDYLVLMSVWDEATALVDDDIAQALSELGVSEKYRDAYRQSYLGIMSGGRSIYEAFSDGVLEYEYTEGNHSFYLKSAGADASDIAEITVNEETWKAWERGLHIVVFDKRLGIVQDRIVFDLYSGLDHICSL